MAYLVDISSSAALDASVVGQKAATLARLQGKGYEIPHAVIVSTALLCDLFDGQGAVFRSLPKTVDGRFSLEQPAIQRLSSAIRLPSELLKELREFLEGQPDGKRFAVRSSSPSEDCPGASFAGQFDTFLNRAGFDSICEAVTLCLLSPFSSRVAAYLKFHDIAGEPAMAVMIQEMVEADVAGVAFSINPTGLTLNEVMINAHTGLGTAVVDGEEEVEVFVLPKTGTDGKPVSECAATPSPKAAGKPALLPDQQAAIGSLAVSLEAQFAFPQDVEWALKDQKIYLLQARPVTVIPERWTRDDVTERFPNAVTPLSSDFIEEGFRRSVKNSLSLMSFPPFRGTWLSNKDHFLYSNANVLDVYRRRLLAAFRHLQQGMKGVRLCLDELSWVYQPMEHWRRNIDVYLTTLGALVDAPLPVSDERGLWEYCINTRDTAYAYFGWNIAITMAHGALFGLLREVLKFVHGSDKGTRALSDLTSACKTKTAQMDRELRQLAALIQADGPRDLFAKESAERLSEEMKKKPVLHRDFEQFVKRHAHREIDNLLDMYYPTLGERPDVVIENLKLLVEGNVEIPSASQEAIRYREALSETISACPAEFRTDLLELIETTRAYIELDDTEHYETTRLQVPLRKGLLVLGQKLTKKGILAEPPDIFFGRCATIDDAMRVGNFSRLRAEVRLNKQSFRKAEGRSAETAAPAGVVMSNGSVVLEGLPCSAGYVEGRVCVINTLGEFKKLEKGAILVARATPPAWSPLFYVASAIVTEAGGALSHGAILARELRLPAIMGVKGLLREIRDGDRIGVDGNTGRISRLA